MIVQQICCCGAGQTWAPLDPQTDIVTNDSLLLSPSLTSLIGKIPNLPDVYFVDGHHTLRTLATAP
jgi:hypothetical protein